MATAQIDGIIPGLADMAICKKTEAILILRKGVPEWRR